MAQTKSPNPTLVSGRQPDNSRRQSADSKIATAQLRSAKSATVDRLELLETFVRIVEAGSISAAAKLLNSSQPTISRRLKSLEHYLGLQLLQRSTHQLVLTPDGERSYESFRTLLATWGAMESEIRGARDEPVGHLRVLAPHAFGQDKLIAPLAHYLASYPGMTLEWNLHDDRSLHDFIAEGIDCAIQVGNLRDSNLVARHLGDIPRMLIAAPDFLSAGLSLQHPAQLQELPWVALTTFYQNELEFIHTTSAERIKIEFQTKLRTDNLYAMKNAVLHKIGIAVGSSWVMQEDLAAGRLVQLLPEWQVSSLPVNLLYPYAPFYPAKLRCFIDLMRQVLPEIFGCVGQAS